MTQKVKFGIIGFGRFGEKLLIPAFNDCKKAELIAITKRDLETAIQIRIGIAMKIILGGVG